MIRLILWVLVIFYGACLPASAQLFEITLPTFSTFVTNDGNYTPIGPAIDGKISRASLSHGLLYFSFTVYAGQAALDYVQQMHRLEVVAVILGDQSEIVSGLGITQEKWIAGKAAWTSQLSQLGYFTFRTYMNTEKISRDKIGIQVRDVKGNIARPIGYSLLAYEADVTIIP